MAISKEKLAMAKQMGMGERTFRKYLKVGDFLKKTKELAGKEKADLFSDIVGKHQFSSDKILRIAELSDYRLILFIEQVCNEPDKFINYYNTVVPEVVNISCTVSKDTNEKLIAEAKKCGMSKKAYIEYIINMFVKD